jgi:tRNA G18 (ribose-2'-O)-methylase SpoU
MTYPRKPIRLVLYDLQSAINLGMILRIAENFGADAHVFDPRGVLQDSANRTTISDFACGALQRRPPKTIRAPAGVKRMRRSGRLIATSIDGRAVELPDLVWQPGDIIMMGNEYDGLPEPLITAADLLLRIPQPPHYAPKPRSHRPIDPERSAGVAHDGVPNLNVAVATGIICFAAYLALDRKNFTKAPPAMTGKRRLAAPRISARR